MKVNFNKVESVIIKNKDGDVLENFALGGASFVQHQLHGNVLTLVKKV